MASVSMGDVWDDTRDFVTRERALILPLGFATFGLASLILMLASPVPTEKGVQFGPWMFWLIPVFLLMELGYLAMSLIALRSAISVREALQRALYRLGEATLTLFLIAVAGFAMIVLCALLGQILAGAAGMGAAQAVSLATAIAVFPICWLAIRLVLIWAMLIDRRGTPIEAIRMAFSMTRQHSLRIAGVFFASIAAYILLTVAVQFGGGTVLLLLGKLIGRPSVGETLLTILSAAMAAGYLSVWTIFRALLYRRLSGSINGM